MIKIINEVHDLILCCRYHSELESFYSVKYNQTIFLSRIDGKPDSFIVLGIKPSNVPWLKDSL